MSKLVTAIVIGSGQRGFNYSNYALMEPTKFKIVGVAEPNDIRRNKLAALHSIPEENIFKCWSKIDEREKFADCALITTLDQMHHEPAIALAAKGYHIFLEKPMATSYKDCVDIVKSCEKNKLMLAVGHVLRYDAHSLKINEILKSGCIGDIVNIQHLEPIGYWHFTHSFVRGNWRNNGSSTFMLLAKCCHDLDLIQLWMGKVKCTSIVSFGSLFHFKSSNKPSGATDRCMTCPVEPTCQFSAKKLYLEMFKDSTNWPVKVVCEDPTKENLTTALKTGPYGKCVYDCDNNVVDNQVVILQYDNGATVNFSTVAFTELVCARQTKIFGTKGEITCRYNEPIISVFDFLSNTKTEHQIHNKNSLIGHKDADMEAIRSFVAAVSLNDRTHILTGPEESLRSHLLCFAAELSRLQNKVVDMNEELF